MFGFSINRQCKKEAVNFLIDEIKKSDATPKEKIAMLVNAPKLVKYFSKQHESGRDIGAVFDRLFK